MKKALAIAGALALALTPAESFAWHLWRTESEMRSETRPGGNLSHANMERRNLSGANLSGANVRNANLIFANLSGANLSNAQLNSSLLIRANLTGANLNGVIATNIWGCPSSLPSGWFCENNSLIQR